MPTSDPPPSVAATGTTVSFGVSRSLFLRAVGVCYFIALGSLWIQLEGLIGASGILPAERFLEAVRGELGPAAYWRLPTLYWLVPQINLAALTGLGVLLAALVVIGVAPAVNLLLLWIIYLSLSVAGQDFLGFQWDTLLTETGFLAVWYAPLTWWLSARRQPDAHPISRWLVWLLLFKLMFLSGITKLLSGDPTWRDLSAMSYHYQTQPLPNAVSWYMHQLPMWLHRGSVLFAYFAELIVPWLIFTSRRFRNFACAVMVALQIGIAFTGNYGFFNLLSTVLCLTLLDDATIAGCCPSWLRRRNSQPALLDGESRTSTQRFESVLASRIAKLSAGHRSLSGWALVRRDLGQVLLAAAATFLLTVSGLVFVREMVRTHAPDTLPVVVNRTLAAADAWLLGWGQRYVLVWTDPWRTVNGYGLFRVMTTERPEIVLEASNDRQSWQEYEFRWKPGDLQRRPGFVAPHQPRLDWQMWFAALNPPRHAHWLASLVQGLLRGEPAVVSLMRPNQFDDPPRYIRLVMYRYEFTGRAARDATGKWWERRNRRVISEVFVGQRSPPAAR